MYCFSFDEASYFRRTFLTFWNVPQSPELQSWFKCAEKKKIKHSPSGNLHTRAEKYNFRAHSVDEINCRSVETSVMRKFQDGWIQKSRVNWLVKINDLFLIRAFIVAHQHRWKVVPRKLCHQTVLVRIKLSETISFAIIQTCSDEVELNFRILRAQGDATIVSFLDQYKFKSFGRRLFESSFLSKYTFSNHRRSQCMQQFHKLLRHSP